MSVYTFKIVSVCDGTDLSGLERGRVVSVHDEGYVLCDHKRHYYDAIKVSDELMAEIEPELQEGRTVIYDHNKGQVRMKWQYRM